MRPSFLELGNRSGAPLPSTARQRRRYRPPSPASSSPGEVNFWSRCVHDGICADAMDVVSRP